MRNKTKEEYNPIYPPGEEVDQYIKTLKDGLPCQNFERAACLRFLKDLKRIVLVYDPMVGEMRADWYAQPGGFGNLLNSSVSSSPRTKLKHHGDSLRLFVWSS